MKQGLLIDMDGVIYSGETLIEGADKFIAYLRGKMFRRIWIGVFCIKMLWFVRHEPGRGRGPDLNRKYF
ncbi:MAG TPA: hypothetical protein VFX43_07880, partial [Chitinophagaceae bacterium]|nr:hypothetical protein [Chitinophagaceae bacterium]